MDDIQLLEARSPIPANVASPSGAKVALRKWAFAMVPLVGLLELGLHFAQISGGPRPEDWSRARDVIRASARPEDLVLVAPRWLDPLGRQHLGADILTVEREARGDESDFPRAIQVSLGGTVARELAGWKRVDKQSAGRLTVSTFENPTPARVLDRLLAHAGPDGMRVARVDGGRETECAWSTGATQAGSLGFGPAIPGAKFVCPGGNFAGVSIIATLDYTPRRCFYVQPPAGESKIRLDFKDISFGRMLHGHHGLYVEAERSLAGAPVSLLFSVEGRQLGTVTHNDGDGWRSFDLPTDSLAGERHVLSAEITTRDANRRMYCFEADTR